MSGLSHTDEAGAARMVDVSAKADTARIATATGRIDMNAAARDAIADGSAAKGDVFAAARIAGIMAAKKTSELIPLCHPLPITGITLDLALDATGATASATVKTSGKTGVEMEALTAVSIALLTLYDMLKAVDKHMMVRDIHVTAKAGGKSGDWTA
ncbi:cyclic pyranopterin phosphate synthase [Sphingobium xanthum]|uniref:cyclic pyranopterin monophosphate synthase MoaC n=1 Tax=Sphingobium xanthum TaxID=1387165 RepID=UPI001C8BB6B1|nr:cyclic pyranopterin monophosphate synthase MoaC [Sphingobium xanthum]